MELNSPFQRLNAPKAPEQPKVEFDEMLQRLIKDKSQELQPLELGDNDTEPTIQELQHRIFMAENNFRRLLDLITDHGDDALALAAVREFREFYL